MEDQEFNDMDDLADDIQSAEEVAAEMLKNMETRAHYPSLEESDSYFTKLTKMRTYYNGELEKILAYNARRPERYYRAYIVDWVKILTPIELEAWKVIRMFGGIALYPQFPAGRFQLDFAAPHKMIGVELDGKAYHNAEKDLARDKELSELGWTIYRITGSEMHRVYDPFETEYNTIDEATDALKDYLFNTGEGVLYAIRVVHFAGDAYFPAVFQMLEDDIDWTRELARSMCREALAVRISVKRSTEG